mmetsp:Transcript_12683/g.27426  ORF Transcript_12683/g.27426 Transcript_12683/m.27426 type:complete len:127 (-) Transcript_12683:424-804(-)
MWSGEEGQAIWIISKDGLSATVFDTKSEVSVAKLDMPASFEILYQNNIWICDTVATSHLTPYRLGTRNIRDSGSASLGHAGEAMKATNTIDLSGQFVARYGGLGMGATLADCNFNESLNSNLMSLI